MKNFKMFYDALEGLMWSWGGNPPPEAVWAFNDFIDWYEKETGNIIGIRIEDEEEILEYKEIMNRLCDFEK